MDFVNSLNAAGHIIDYRQGNVAQAVIDTLKLETRNYTILRTQSSAREVMNPSQRFLLNLMVARLKCWIRLIITIGSDPAVTNSLDYLLPELTDRSMLI